MNGLSCSTETTLDKCVETETETSLQDLPIEAAADLLSRFASLADTFVFQSSVSLVELEQVRGRFQCW